MSGSGGRRKTDGLSEAVEPGGNQLELFLARQLFYCSFTSGCTAPVGKVFEIYGSERTSALRIFGASAAAVRSEAFLEIVGPARVKGAVTALQDVYAGSA